MAKDPGDGPKLELPSFGRRRRPKAEPPAEVVPEAAGPVLPQVERQAEPQPEPRPEPQPEPQSGREPELEPEPAPPSSPEPLLHLEPAPETGPIEDPAPVGGAHTTRTLSVAPREPALGTTAGDPAPRGALLPSIGVLPASAVTGVLVGLVTVGLTWLSQRGCQTVRGTSSCGGGPGLLLLLAVLAVAILVGSVLLQAWGVGGPGSTSVLAVALVAVVAMLFLTDVLLDWWMVVVIPAAGAVAFAVSAWVTTSSVEPAERAR